MPRNPVPVVPEADRKVLESWVRSTSVPAGLARRARIVLLAADGVGTNEIVDKTGSTRPTVTAWRNRYITEGLAGLDDRPKKGREPEIDQIEVINATLQAPPEHLGITHWSSRILGKQLGISKVTVPRSGSCGASNRSSRRRSSSPPTRNWRQRSVVFQINWHLLCTLFGIIPTAHGKPRAPDLRR